MILVTTGTQKFPFNRLLKAVDEEIKAGVITEDVFAQIGASDYQPENYKYSPFLTSDEMQNLRKQSRLIITHAGTNSIIEGLKLGIPVITVPRRKEFGEHVDDHQMEITEEFEKEGLVTAVYDIDKLGDAIRETISKNPPVYSGHDGQLLQKIVDLCTGKEQL